MAIVTARIDEELKKKMAQMRRINWSEVIRDAILHKIEEEELWKAVNSRKLAEAAIQTDSLRRKIEGWDSTAEIRRWRERGGSGG